MPNEPQWLTEARKTMGYREVPGAPTAPFIAAWLGKLGAWWRDDETPWCGTAVAAWMLAAGLATPKAWYRAREWLNWGIPLLHPEPGCVVVFERPGGGHVGLVVAQDTAGRLLVLGGNQGDRVCVAPFDYARVLGFRWPGEREALLVPAKSLPIVASAGAASKNEA